MTEAEDSQVKSTLFTCQTSYLGMQEQPPANLKFPTWRVELMDENNQPTDIWAECWNTGSGWKVDYLQILTVDLTDALCVCYRSLLDYLRDGRPLDAKFN